MIGLVTLRLYARRLEAPAPSLTAPPGVELEVWDSPAAAGESGTGWHPEAEPRFRAGQACAVARQGGDVVAYCWLTRTPEQVAEIGRVVVPGPGDVYLYDAYTRPAWRGRGLFTALLLRLVTFAHDRGWRRALIFVLASNRPSRRAIERAGFEILRAVSRVEIYGLRRLLFSWPWSARSRLTLASRPRP